MPFKRTPLSLIAALLLFALNAFSQSNTIPKNGDEFTGPFNSWLNVKQQFGAKGNGTADDTAPLQAAINAAGTGTGNSTIYLPAGTYRITQTLTVNYHINISIIGADPATTIIKWAGAAHGTMMLVNGTAYSRFNRVTWNGNRVADVAVEQSWDGKKPYFDTGNEYADDIFTDVAFGIHGGNLKRGFAETSILRDRFIRNSTAGVSLGNFNALDIWIRNSLFRDCGTGVTNSFGAGNFRLYQNVFINSANADISIGNTGGFSIRQNTSVNAKQFFYAIATGNPATTIIEGNTIIDPINTQAITIGNQGPTIFMNNTIRSRTSASSGPVVAFNNTSANSFATGNRFTVANAVSTGAGVIAYDNKTVASGSLGNLAVPKLPGAEPNLHRRVFEVPPGANAKVIQAVINKAALASGSRPIVHIPYGNYLINTTLFIPANTDMQLVGDGYGEQYASVLTWSGTAPAPVICINGPGKATLRDFTIRGNAACTNILITNADQRGARVYLQEFNQKGGEGGMLVNQLDNTLVFAYDSQFSGLKKAVSVIGGQKAANGHQADGRTVIYSGAESNNNLSHEVLNGGNLTVQDTWYEGGMKSTYIKLSGKGIFTAAGDLISTPEHTDVPSVVVNNFVGKALFLADNMTDRFAISGNGAQANLLALGILAEDYPFIADASAPKANMRVLFSRTRDHNPGLFHRGSYGIPDVGTNDQAFINSMLINLKNIRPVTLTTLPPGVSDIRIYRVMSINGAQGLDIEAGGR